MQLGWSNIPGTTPERTQALHMADEEGQEGLPDEASLPSDLLTEL